MSDDYVGTDVLELLVEARNYNRAIVKLARSYSGGKRWLDFGAGLGTMTDLMSTPGIQIDCVEPDTRGRKLLESKGHKSFAEYTDCKEAYDFIYLFNVLEHIENDSDVLHGLSKLLAPGGKIFVYVPAFQMLYSKFDRRLGHFRRYTRASLTATTERAGLRVLKARYMDSLGFFAALFYRFLPGSESGRIGRWHVTLFDRVFFPMSVLLDYALGYFIGKNVYALIEKK